MQKENKKKEGVKGENIGWKIQGLLRVISSAM
jgi:hypothetical protein